jgi:hypothetical protein
MVPADLPQVRRDRVWAQAAIRAQPALAKLHDKSPLEGLADR